MNNRKRTRPTKSFRPPADGLCPICGQHAEPDEWQGHHVIPHSRGGCDRPINIVVMCRTCHLTITNGTSGDAIHLHVVSRLYQMARFGLQFVLYFYRMARKNNEKSMLGDHFVQSLNNIKSFPDRRSADKWAREQGSAYYRLFRDAF